MQDREERLSLFMGLSNEVLRRYASRIQLRNASEIKGGKEALAQAILAYEEHLGLGHPLVRQYSYVIGLSRDPKRTLVDFDLSTDDVNLGKFLEGIPYWPQKILQAELEYTLKYDEPLPGWTDLDLLRYTMRFYPYRRQGLLRHDRLTREIRNQLRRDPVDRVRHAAIRSDWQVTQ
jgi:hypothetical protein